MNKTLIVILSETRASGVTFEKFKKGLLDVFQADLALCVANNSREDTENPFYKMAKYVWVSEEYDDWGEGIEQVVKNCHPKWRNFKQFDEDQWLGGIQGENVHPGSGGITIYFRAFLKKCLIESNVLEHYERVIITRSDYMYDTAHVPPKLLDNKFIWIPDGEQYGGYTDRHIVCPADKALEALSVADIFKHDPEELIPEMRKRYPDLGFNPERFFKYFYEVKELTPYIRLFPYTMYTVREAGGHSSWRHGRFSSQLNLYVKYPWEFRRQKIANFVLGDDEWSQHKINVYNCLYRCLLLLRNIALKLIRRPHEYYQRSQ